MVRRARIVSHVPGSMAGRLKPRNPSQRTMWSRRNKGTRMIPMCMRKDDAVKKPGARFHVLHRDRPTESLPGDFAPGDSLGGGVPFSPTRNRTEGPPADPIPES